MHDPSAPERLNRLDDEIQNLREQIQKKEIDPAAVGSAVAAIHLDNIARIRTYMNQLDVFTGYQLFCDDLTLARNLARAGAILRLMSRLTIMQLKQVDCFLKCFGGTNAIAIQKIATWAREDPTRAQWLLAFADAARSRRKG